ncbi:helix-turn-helix transcriptional regulator [Isoptericola sp. S6320L]|uniref:helix-turn-helix transcriptional regulator n=1 Tax=Isoptericola sp. S6320L TaxID=2926411 RepID=UPI001FF12F88|nr:helix-turn-helix transcriptional regulator [Isoptericola sp. S6320L]MCK0115691.1 helix-turn-helix transcriptional regulator [Isoptericola sp. S6320L]
MLALTASVQGPLSDVTRHATAALSTARRHGLAQPVTLAEWALARAELVEGRPADAAGRLVTLLAPSDGGAHFALRGLVLPTLVEAAVGAGDRATARAAMPELTAWGRSASDPQSPALLLRCAALLAASDADADARFHEAHVSHLASGGTFEAARTLLLHGSRLRRRRRPSDARDRLRDALRLFERAGADPWADRTRTELRAAGGAQHRPAPGDLTGLTPHQLRIARRVAAGDTNREIAERLSVSVRTVDCHLRNIFVALGVRSRVELARQVPPATGPTSP